MSREKQIEEMFNIIADGVIDGEDNHGVPTGITCLNIARTIYDAGYRKQSEWISVDKRLPKPFVSVLVYIPEETPHPTVHEGFANKRGEWYAGCYDRLPDEVVAWMDMPEPPKTD